MHTASSQPTFIARLTELVGADKAAMLAVEFGGTQTYWPNSSEPPTKPLRLQIDAVIDPAGAVSGVVNAIAAAVYGLNRSGLGVQALRIETHGQGQAYMEALQARTDLGESVAVQLGSANAASFPPALHDFLLGTVEDAFRKEMARLMAGAVTCRPEQHHEWLATAQTVLEQRLSALAWHESMKTTLTQPTPPPSAA